MFVFNFLRFRATPPRPLPPPPRGKIDVWHDALNNQIVASDDRGSQIPFAGTGSGSTEFKEATVTYGDRASLVDLDAKSLTSLSLTQGTWDVEGMVSFVDSTASVSNRAAEINQDEDAQAITPFTAFGGFSTTLASGVHSLVVPRQQVVVTGSPVTIYLNAVAGFSAGSVAAFGNLTARLVS